jgi:hypothetical protein
LATLLAQFRFKRIGGRVFATRAALCVAGFVICVAPYWVTVGRFSTKKDPFEWLRREVAVQVTPAASRAVVPAPDAPQHAKLVRHDVPWYALLPYALQQLFRAGRVVVPLLALLPLLNLRRRWLHPDLVGLTTCFAGHLCLTLLLLARHDYLQQRHMLVNVALLTPFAGMFLARLVELALSRHRRVLAGVVVGGLLLPLMLYSLRIPNSQDAYYRDAITWLRAQQPDLSDQTLLGGSSSRRIAFYTGMPWSAWAEEPDAYDNVVYRIRQIAPGYFALETGPGDERAGNQLLLERLLADDMLAHELTRAHTIQIDDASALHLLRATPPPQP